MKNSARAVRRVQRNNALAISSRRRAKRSQMYGDVRKTAPESAAIVQMQPNLRITPVMQAEILRFYAQGCSLCEIAWRTHRARQTVTKVVRAPDIQAKVQELRERLLGESDDWLESINFAVTHETDARLAYKLSEALGIIPSLSKKAAPVKPQDEWEGVDPQTMARAKMLAMEAQRRAALLPPENDELEKLVPTVRSKVPAVR
jgi:hypothetical protein